MATKTELEAELAVLRRQLAERDKAAEERTAETAKEPADDPDTDGETSGEDWDALFKEIVEEFENLPQKRPLLVAAGIFAFGWLIGRSSR